jgi:hypothetical protein
MLDFEHVFHCSQFSRCSLHSLTLFALTFLCVSHFNLVIFFVLFQTCRIFVRKVWWLKGRCGGSREGVVAQWEGVVAQWEGVVAQW